jgi:L-amino acid N-acyltransferase YncA
MSSIVDEGIREVRETDASRLAEIYGYYVTYTTSTFETVSPSAREWRSRIEARSQAALPFVVLERDNLVLGYAYASQWRPRPAYRHTVESTVYLEPDSTGSGRGRRLMDALVGLTQAAGAREMIAVVAEPGDPASVALHRKLGFRDVGVLRNVGTKMDRWIDTRIMQKSVYTPD